FGLACSENPEMTLARVMVQADTAMLRQKRAQRKIAHKEIKTGSRLARATTSAPTTASRSTEPGLLS
ncbi:MAG: hypothetical protein U0M13_08695, partial [Desulfovibrio fairfieldensis]|nr:hypothetical protein [Desulfovibrio fairfieldensis]